MIVPKYFIECDKCIIHTLTCTHYDRIIIAFIVSWFKCIYWIEKQRAQCFIKEKKKKRGGIANSLLIYIYRGNFRLLTEKNYTMCRVFEE